MGAITTLGKGTPKAFRPGNADVSISSNSQHGDFAGAYTAKGQDGVSAKDIVDKSYNQ